jgi:hypothetical protein
MIIRVGFDDVAVFRCNNEWLKDHPGEALIFARPDEVWKVLEQTYSGDFRGLVYGSFPPASDVLSTLKAIATRVNEIKWNVQIV